MSRAPSPTRRALAALALSSTLLVATLANADLSTVTAALGQLDRALVAVGAGLALCVLVARTLRLRALLDGANLWTLGSITALQTFFLRVTPFRLGELSFPVLLARHLEEPAPRSLAYLLLIRFVELGWVVGCGLAASAAGLDWVSHTGTVGLVTALFVAPLLLSALPDPLSGSVLLADRALSRLARGGRWDERLRWLSQQLHAVAEALRSLTLRQRLAVVYGSLCVVALQYLMLAALAASAGVSLEPWQAVAGISLAQVSSALPLATVGTFGSYEAGWTLGFALVGVSPGAAVASAVASQLLSLGFAVAFAAPAGLLLGGRSARRVQRLGTP